MNTIETLENQIATRTEINSPSVIWAYVVTKETGNEHLDFSEYISDTDLPGLTKELDALGIDTFTVSAGHTGMAAFLQGICQQGWNLTGITNVKERFADILTGERRERPAFKLERN